MFITRNLIAALLAASPAFGQETTNFPFATPINATDDIIVVDVVEFATIPDVDGAPARIMSMTDEPGTRRAFASEMNGIIYTVSYDGRTVAPYLDLRDARWGVAVQNQGASPTSLINERGLQSFAFHPQFNQAGAPGYGKLYTWLDVADTTAVPDYQPGGGTRTHHTVLLEWTARNLAAGAYDGAPPRQLMRFEQPFINHNGGHMAFRPNAVPGDADYGLLYIGMGDGGSGGDPLDNALKLSSMYGKLLRIDPLGSNGPGGRYGIPADNPFVGRSDAHPEIYAYGIRNPQRFNWDSRTGNLYLADVGQNVVEEVSLVPRGGNLGWNDWEASFRYEKENRQVRTEGARGDPTVTFPVVEYAQPFPLEGGGTSQPLLQPGSAATGVHVFRDGAIPQLEGKLVFGDMVQGEIFYVDADNLPNGGQAAIRRVLLRYDGQQPKTLLELVQEKNIQQGRMPAPRTDLRFGWGPNGQVTLLNKRDGIIRLLVPPRT